MITFRDKYVRLTAAVAGLFLLLLLTEVYGRLQSAVKMFMELKEKEKSLMTPDEIILTKRALLIEQAELSAFRKESIPGIAGRESDLFAYLTACAAEQRITIESFTPADIKSADVMAQAGFAISFRTDFHRAAAFINGIETGAFPVSITGLSMVSDPPGTTELKVSVSGRARLLACAAASGRK